MIERGELTAGHGRALLAIEDRPYMEHVAGRAVAEGWSVRQVEEAASLRRGAPSAAGRPRVREVRPAEVIELEQRQEPREWLSTLVHEALHVAFPHMEEKAIAAAEKRVAGILWRAGVRRVHQ